jgi:hypothetical protein
MRLKPRDQGDLGEYAAAYWLSRQGAQVFIPFGHSPDVDLVADVGDELLRVQVKTSTYSRKPGRWEIMIATRGGNQSWSGLTKRFDRARCDRLFVLVADGRQWFIPTDAIPGGTGVTLGGPKYARYEVERGRPIAGGER